MFLFLTLLLFPAFSLSGEKTAPGHAPETGKTVQASPGTDIRDIKGPVLPKGFPLEIPAGLVAAGILAVFAGYKINKMRKTLVFASPSPEEMSCAALDLLARDLADTEMAPAQASRLGDILRRYLRDRFGLNALKLTTAEVAPALKNLGGFTAEDLKLIEKSLNEADAAKFALSFPSPEETAVRVGLCREMIVRIAKRPAP